MLRPCLTIILFVFSIATFSQGEKNTDNYGSLNLSVGGGLSLTHLVLSDNVYIFSNNGQILFKGSKFSGQFYGFPLASRLTFSTEKNIFGAGFSYHQFKTDSVDAIKGWYGPKMWYNYTWRVYSFYGSWGHKIINTERWETFLVCELGSHWRPEVVDRSWVKYQINGELGSLIWFDRNKRLSYYLNPGINFRYFLVHDVYNHYHYTLQATIGLTIKLWDKQ